MANNRKVIEPKKISPAQINRNKRILAISAGVIEIYFVGVFVFILHASALWLLPGIFAASGTAWLILHHPKDTTDKRR